MAPPAQASQKGSIGPPATQAAIHPSPKVSQTTHDGGIDIPDLTTKREEGVGVAKTADTMATETARIADFILFCLSVIEGKIE